MFRKLCVLLIGAIVLAGCAKNAVMEPRAGEAVSVVNIKVFFDGNKDSRFLNRCSPSFVDSNSKTIYATWHDDSTGYFVIKSPTGAVRLNTMECQAYKVLYNKTRRFRFNDLYFVANANTVNYAGDLTIDWTPNRVAVSDFFNLGAMGDDSGVVVMKLDNNIAGVNNFLRNTYPEKTIQSAQPSLLAGSGLIR